MSNETINKICPRCKSTYSYIERRVMGNRVYLLAVHQTIIEGKRRIRKCYLGPEGGYVYTEKIHRLELTNMIDQEYLESAVNSIERAIEIVESTHDRSNVGLRLELLSELERLLLELRADLEYLKNEKEDTKESEIAMRLWGEISKHLKTHTTPTTIKYGDLHNIITQTQTTYTPNIVMKILERNGYIKNIGNYEYEILRPTIT